MQIHAMSAPIDTVLISGTCSVCTDTTVCSLLTSAHDMVAVIADNKTTEYIIMLFPALDIDFEKPLDINRWKKMLQSNVALKKWVLKEGDKANE